MCPKWKTYEEKHQEEIEARKKEETMLNDIMYYSRKLSKLKRKTYRILAIQGYYTRIGERRNDN